jgi:hypothetical protein
VPYNYPNDRRNGDGAIPVYTVATPQPGPPWPNKQNTGAIPITIVAAPITANAGAIPVRFVVATGPGPNWPSDQGQDAGAIPVYNSVAANAMPVWDASGPAPIPPPVITTAGFINTLPLTDVVIVGTCQATNSPTGWTVNNNGTILNLQISVGSGQLILLNGTSITADAYDVIVGCYNVSGFDSKHIYVIYT